MTRLLLVLIIGLVLILGVFSAYLYWQNFASHRPETEIKESRLVSLTVTKPNLAVYSQNIDRVEIYLIPTGTGITKDQAILLGEPQLISRDSDGEWWRLPIPTEPILGTEIFARGFNDDEEVAEVSLGIMGATEIYNALWGDDSSSVLLSLKVGQIGSTENLSLKLNKILSDNRCPQGVMCIQAGEVVLEVRVISKTTEENLILKTSEEAKVFGDFMIDIISVEPLAIPGQNISPADYLVTFSISRI